MVLCWGVLKWVYWPYNLSKDLSTPVLPSGGAANTRLFGADCVGYKGEETRNYAGDSSAERSSEDESDGFGVSARS